MKPYFTDEQATLYLGDALTVLQSLPDASINCCVTSPPYFGLRDYGVDGQLGSEPSPSEYVAALIAVFSEVRRALAKDGTLWLNLGDSYYSGKGSPTQPDAKNEARRPPRRVLDQPGAEWGRPKSLLGIPWRVAFALQDDGWILRNDIIWAKPNGMPESVTDRLSTKHEHLFLLTKSRRYYFNLDPIREPLAYPTAADGTRVFGGTGNTYGAKVSRRDSFARATKDADVPGQSYRQHREDRPDVVAGSPAGRNPGDVWTIPTQPFTEAHFAVFPVEIPRRAIAAGCKPGGVVLDPFSGSGTTGLAAAELGRRYVGIDLNRDYLELSLRTRLSQPSLTAEVGS